VYKNAHMEGNGQIMDDESMDAGLRNHARENSPDRLGEMSGAKSSMGMKVKSFPNPNVI